MPGQPLYRGQGNGPYPTAVPQPGARRGQESPYDLNGRPTGAALSDGTYGDITVSSGGTVWTVAQATKLRTARTLAATGDVTWSGSFDGSANFSVTATIANSAVTLAKMANVATGTVFYRKTAGTGAPEVQTLATLKTDLGLTGTNSGDQTSVTGNAGTATALQTARNIDGQSFNGTADITVIAPGTHAATSKATPVDADELPLVDSAASNVLKKLTWANLKATIRTYLTGTANTWTALQSMTGGHAGFYNDNSANYTLALVDAGGVVNAHNAGARTLTIPPNSSVAFPIGTIIRIVSWSGSTTTIGQGSGVSLFWYAGTGTPAGPANRSLTDGSWCDLVKINTDTWGIMGQGIS